MLMTIPDKSKFERDLEEQVRAEVLSILHGLDIPKDTVEALVSLALGMY